MAFLNPIFLIALAAVAAPIIIHLIFRLRKRVVVFGSLRFLEQIVKKNRRRLRLRDLLLLLLRVAALALIALAFARPYLRASGAGNEDTRSDTVFVLDDTFSMGAARLARTAFDEAKARVIEELSALEPGDRAGLVLVTGARVVSQLAADGNSLRAGVRAKVRAAALTWQRAELAPALRAAAGLLAVSDAPRKRIAIASDLQLTSWTEAALAALPREGIEYAALLGASSEPNITVVSAEAVSEFWTPGVPVIVRARVANFGATDAGGIVVKLLVGADKTPRAQRTVTIPAGAETTVELAFDAAAAGEFPAAVSLAARDALAADDTRYVVLRLRGRSSVLLVQDEVFERDRGYFARGDFLRDESYFLARALDPRPGRAADEGPSLSPYAPEEIATRALDAAAIRRADVVCLLGVTRLADEQVRALGDYVRAGGGLLLVFTDACDATAALVAAGLAPAKVGDSVEAGPLHPEGVAIAQWDRAHLVWAAFGTEPGTGATGPDRVRVRRYLWLEPVEAARVLAHLDGGKPAVVELTFAGAGANTGKVVQLAFDLSARSTNFPKRKAYVPFVHGLVGYLARSSEKGSARAVEVGAPLPLATAGGVIANDAGEAELVTPDGSTLRLAAAGPAPVLERPGIYRVRMPRDGRSGTTLLAANVSPAESDLRTGARGKLLAALGSTANDSAGVASRSIDSIKMKHDGGRSAIWAVLLGLVGCILLVESLLAGRVLLGARGDADGDRSQVQT